MSETRGKVILARLFGIKKKRYISLVLTYSKGNYILEHPNYEYMNRIAHFKSVQNDIRLSLNKTYLGSIIHALKRAGVWPYIMNKNFLRVTIIIQNQIKERSEENSQVYFQRIESGGHNDRSN